MSSPTAPPLNEHNTTGVYDAQEGVPAAEEQHDQAISGKSNKERSINLNSREGRLGVFCVLPILIIGVVLFAANRVSNRSDKNGLSSAATPPAPTPAPTAPLCPNKRIRFTEICEIPDLDDDWWGTDITMDIKILVNDKQYWPRDTVADCIPQYGSYEGSCVIPDTSLEGCFPLKNQASLEYGGDTPPPDNLKATIYDVDIFTDEFLDIMIPKDDWYFSGQCQDGIELWFYVPGKKANVKMVVDTIEEGDEMICGADLDAIAVGLDQTAAILGDMELTLTQYVTLSEERRGRGRDRRERELFFGALISGARFLVSGVGSLVGSFARGARSQGLLSTLADFTTIGSVWFASNDASGEDKGAEYWAKTEEQFKKVFERFDQIDTHLDGIQTQLQQGFQQMELVVNEAFAKQELDDWINGHLAVLNDDYRAYLDPNHTPATRKVYENVFRNSCRQEHSPFTSFKVLYGHACQDCTLLDGTSQQYILDTFVDLAKANFDTVIDRILWFRRSFGVVIIGSLTEAMYLHSVCLYQSEAICQNEDPVWISRLEEMGTALEEVALSLTEAEKRLE